MVVVNVEGVVGRVDGGGANPGAGGSVIAVVVGRDVSTWCHDGGWVSVDGGGALAGAGAGGGHHRCRHVVGRVEMVVMA